MKEITFDNNDENNERNMNTQLLKIDENDDRNMNTQLLKLNTLWFKRKNSLNVTLTEQQEVETSDIIDELMEESFNQGEKSEVDQTLNKEEDYEEESDIDQLAFESLDYARIVCEKHVEESSIWFERQKETLILLSKVELNSGNISTAIEDLNGALKIIDAYFPHDLREASYVHLELARVYRMNKEFPEANSHIEKSIEALEKLRAKIHDKPQEGISLLEIDEISEDLLAEKKSIQLFELEEKENLKKQSSEDTPAETVQIKRKEKQAAGDKTNNHADFKKSKTEDPS